MTSLISLGSTGVTADTNNHVQEVTDYKPYGSINNHDQLAGFSEQRKYIGQMYDNDTGLNYLNARYYNSAQGQFLSEDPVFLGDPKSQVLTDPQSLNSYSYANDNPIVKSDPTGRSTPLGTWFAYSPDPGTAMAKQQLLAELQAGYQGWTSAAKFSGAVVASGGAAMTDPAAVPYVLGGWVNAASSAYEDYQNGTLDKSGNSYVGAFLAGAGQETRFIQSGRITSVLAKSTAFQATTNMLINGTVSARSLVANTAGTLAGRITQTATSYSQGSATRVLLTQLSQAVASLAVQIGVLQATAPSQSQSSK